jgi:DHA1 family bicyclomycin/chloramphenicol resistance-like MFS transporter
VTFPSSRLLLLALLSAFPPLSTDMYLAAIPQLQRDWDESLVMVNFTLVGFFAAYCCCLLLYGPLSDRYGRKPPLLTGISVYILASLLCAVSTGVEMMIAARILQGAGAAAASSIVFAMSKDLYRGKERQKVFVHIGMIVAAAPVVVFLAMGVCVASGYGERCFYGGLQASRASGGAR